MHKKIVYRLMIILISVLLLSACDKGPQIPVQITQTGNSDSSENARSYAVVNIKDYGTLKFVLLNDYAPQTVANFCELADSGFFDGKPVYMVIRDYCFIAGQKRSDGVSLNSGNDTYEKNSVCYPLKGALCLTENKESSACFTVIQAGTSFLDELKELLKYKKITPAEYYRQAYGTDIDEKTLDIFEKYGGAPWIYGHCIVFGQLVEGEEILDRICSVEVSDDADFIPMEEILIDNVRIVNE